ncbi:hypothetical protein D3C87_538960 [compost metagenome]
MGELTVIFPVGVEQIGCEIITLATAGVPIGGLIIIFGVIEMHPTVFLTVTL